MNELKHAPAGIVTPLLELAHEVDGLCTADTASSTLPILMYMIQNLSRVEGALVLILDVAYAWVQSKHLSPAVLKDPRCVLPDGTRPAEAFRALERIRLWTMGAARRKLLLLLDRNMKAMFGEAAGEADDVADEDIASGSGSSSGGGGGGTAPAPSTNIHRILAGRDDGYEDDYDDDDSYDGDDYD